jgi:large subunit ribosomal protein L29
MAKDMDRLVAMTDDELNTELLTLKREQMNIRFSRVTQKFENTSRIRKIRRDVARIRTAQVQRFWKTLEALDA